MNEDPTAPDDHAAGRTSLESTGGREYRIGELAAAAGIPIRTLRYYQERKLLPPPRRTGRIGLYSEAHLTRLRVIAKLLDRGHTIEGVRELLSAWEQGRDIAAVLGVEGTAAAAPAEVPVTMTLDELAALFPGERAAETVARAVELGHLDADGDRVTHRSRRRLDATVALVRAGVPLAEILSVGRDLQRSMDDLAETFVRLIVDHVVAFAGDQDAHDLRETLAQLRPDAQASVEAGFASAMDEQINAAIDQALDDR
ncbi:MerR family transcriptional regulator [Actinomadura syzygii]|uniref:MerR family transcriptional regulator n=1 Tax=Actinomadura syzygii TaxID=1427538 RepID=UPI001FEC4DE4|nr:MerR family transcriptional regulator [Actinomadura syzygii]